MVSQTPARCGSAWEIWRSTNGPSRSSHLYISPFSSAGPAPEAIFLVTCRKCACTMHVVTYEICSFPPRASKSQGAMDLSSGDFEPSLFSSATLCTLRTRRGWHPAAAAVCSLHRVHDFREICTYIRTTYATAPISSTRLPADSTAVRAQQLYQVPFCTRPRYVRMTARHFPIQGFCESSRYSNSTAVVYTSSTQKEHATLCPKHHTADGRDLPRLP